MFKKNEPVIRKLYKKDLPALAVLYEEFWNESSDLSKMSRMFDSLKNNTDYILLCAFVNNELAGSVMAVRCNELYGECTPFAVIEDMIVKKKFRRQGIGLALFGEVERILIKKGCSQVLLVTERNRKGTRLFYESVGFSGKTHTGFKKKLAVTGKKT
jgi:ribosomal protein S18 acetylase RimI-like enzyme